MKRFLSLILVISLIFTLPFCQIQVNAGTNGHSQTDALNWARSKIGLSIENNDSNWLYQCVDFIQTYYIYLGQTPIYGSACDYISGGIPSGSGWSRVNYASGITFKPGDIAVWKTYLSVSNSSTINTTWAGHIGIIESADNVGFNCIEQNDYRTPQKVSRNWHYNAELACVIRPFTQSYAPQGNIDGVSGGLNTIRVMGWAFDKDKPTTALAIHVYIGGAAGTGEGHAITANKTRTDVGSAYPGVGNYHGYDEVISTNKLGTQDIYIYAIGVGDGGNTLIGKKAVTIYNKNQNSLPLYKSTVYDGKLYASFDKQFDDHDSVFSSEFKLAELDTKELKQLGEELVSDGAMPYYTIGGVKVDGIWKWRYSGTAITDLIWNVGEPSGDPEDCIAVRTSNGLWDDIRYTSDSPGFIASTDLSKLTPAQSTIYKTNKYVYINQAFPYTYTKELCKALGGHLVTIENQEENDIVQNLLNNDIAYLGGDDIENEGDFKWVLGNSISAGYSNWATGEPNNTLSTGGQDYIRMYGTSGLWDDCSDERDDGSAHINGFVIEYEPTYHFEVDKSKASISEDDIKLIINYADGSYFDATADAQINITDKQNCSTTIQAVLPCAGGWDFTYSETVANNSGHLAKPSSCEIDSKEFTYKFECTECNNSISKSIDINSDNVIDIADVSYCLANIASSNSLCDIDCDSCVSISDISILLSKEIYGKSKL